MKTARHKPYGLLQPLPIASQPWSSISMDFIVKLPVSQSFDSILVIVCRRTKQAHFIPCLEKISAVETAELFINSVYRLHGLPTDIVSDRGSIFTSNFWNALLKNLKVKTNKSSSYPPESDGQTERVNQCLEQYLRCFITYQQDNWVSLLPHAEFAYNKSTHQSTILTPFFANYGFNPRMDKLTEITNEESPTALDVLERIRLTQKVLDESLVKAKEDSKRFADLNRQDHDFQLGDKVWLIRKNIKTKRPSDKLDNKRLGPFVIIEKINPVCFRLKLPLNFKIHPVFHVSLLERYHKSSILNRQEPPPLPIEIDNELEYEVEDILDAKFFNKKLKYLIKWRGYDTFENTWEPEDNLEGCKQILDNFKKFYPDKVIPRKARL